jgi:hypothetical protein
VIFCHRRQPQAPSDAAAVPEPLVALFAPRFFFAAGFFAVGFFAARFLAARFLAAFFFAGLADFFLDAPDAGGSS